MPLELCM